MLTPWKESYDNLDSVLKSRDITLSTKVRLVKDMVFPVVMCGCESWTIKKAEHRRTDAFELWCWRRLLSPLDYKEIQPVHPRGGWSWVFIGRTDVEAETPILWSPDMKSWIIWNVPDAWENWKQEEKGTAEDEMASPMATAEFSKFALSLSGYKLQYSYWGQCWWVFNSLLLIFEKQFDTNHVNPVSIFLC